MTDLQPLTEITLSATGRSSRVLRLSTIAPAKLNMLLSLAQQIVVEYGNGNIGALSDDGSANTDSEMLDSLDRLMRAMWLAHGSEQ